MINRKLQRKLDAATVKGGILAAGVAMLGGYVTRGGRIGFPDWIIVVILVLVCWTVFVTISRLVVARDAGDHLLESRLFWRWMGVRLAVFFAAPILFICWLIALPIGSPWSGISGRALVLLLLVSALLSMIGQGVINSLLVLQRLRGR